MRTTWAGNTVLRAMCSRVGSVAGIEDRDRVRQWVLRLGILTQRALPCQESAELIAEAMRNYE